MTRKLTMDSFRGSSNLAASGNPTPKSKDHHVRKLCNAISQAVSNSVENGDQIGIMFSGGLDSSLIALLAKTYAEGSSVILYCVATADSKDFLNANLASKMLGMNFKMIETNATEIIRAIPKVARVINSNHPVKVSFELPLYLGLEHINERIVLSGQGADELFGGYSRYLKMDKEKLKDELKMDIKKLITKDVKMHYSIAGYFGKNLQMPYLHENVIKTAMQIPIELKVDKGQRKIILKTIAQQLGLPSELVSKQKKAAQYSSGVIKELRKVAKKKGMNINGLIEHLLKE